MPRCRILAGSSSTIRMQAYGSRRFAAPTCTAVAPAIIISMTSSAHDTPPQPITGRGACARHLIYHTQRYRKYRIARETAHFVGYHRPPAHRVDAHAEHRIYQAYSVGTGILACAGYRHYVSPTLGLSFMNTGGGHALYGTCHGCRRCEATCRSSCRRCERWDTRYLPRLSPPVLHGLSWRNTPRIRRSRSR